MRIVSQDERYDIPYEQVILRRDKNVIYLVSRNLIGEEGLLGAPVVAKYSTKEKAIEAMKRCRDTYGDIEYCKNYGLASKNVAFCSLAFRFPKEEELKI